MRGESSSSKIPVLHIVLGVLVAVFVLGLIEESAHARFLEWMPLREGDFAPWTWLTYALVHAHVLHLVFNGWSLWWVGSQVEGEQGGLALLRVLILGVLAGALVWWLSGLGGQGGSQIIGISAAVMAVMVYGLADRKDEMVTILIFFIIPVPMRIRWVLRTLWIVTVCGWIFAELPSRHTWSFWQSAWDTDVAHSAHLGGLVAGAVLARLAGRKSEPSFFVQTNNAVEDAPYLKTTQPALTSADARIEMDHLLDKISTEGFGSLTPTERQRLEQLSNRLR